MKKLLAVLIALNCVSANAYEYSSDGGDERHEHRRDGDWRDRENGEWYESEHHGRKPYFVPPRYQQNYQQPPFQIYLSPNLNSYPRDRDDGHRERHWENREDHRWRERRRELEQMPQTPYFENQFNRDDTHW